MKTPVRILLLLLTTILFLSACNASSKEQIAFELYAEGFSKPVALYTPPDGSKRLFVLEQNGIIRIVQNGKTLKTPFLDISKFVSKAKEQGLLGMAFHPEFRKNGYFFIDYTDEKGSTVIARYHISRCKNSADKNSAKVFMVIKQPFAENNGGDLAFGPDGYLYIATGDGGGKGDPGNNARSIQKYLGKILRIDVDHGNPYAIPDDNPFKWIRMANVVREIWLSGFRNPRHISFDKKSGDLYIADQGESSFEEVDFFKYKNRGGKNYGWNSMEGRHCYPPGSDCISKYFELPIIEYEHSAQNGSSISGGYVYRGNNKKLFGNYIFGDFVSGNVWRAFKENNSWRLELIATSDYQIAAFALDENDVLYLLDYRGKIYKLE